MPQGLEDIRSTLARLTRGDSVIDLLMEFERTIDATELYCYDNWSNGELVQGPEMSKYWFETTWMFPYTMMPDPDGAVRLRKIGCKVSYKKDILRQPRRILAPKDWDNPTTKDAKIDDVPIWLVTINMPMKYVTDQLDAYNEYIEDEINKETYEISQELVPEETEEVDDEEFDDEFDEFDDEEDEEDLL